MIDSSKKYRTRSGLEARLYANDGAGAWPIHGAVNVPCAGWSLRQWHEGGRYSHNGPHDLDLIEVKPEQWHPIYRRDDGSYFMRFAGWPTEESAMRDESAAYGMPVAAWKAPE